MIERLKNESGYSLVEVMVAIMLLAIAIIPMVGMFDAGLRAAVLGSNYDQARALAGKQIERVHSLSYGTVKTSYPSPPAAGTSEEFNSSGRAVYQNQVDPDPLFNGFTYEVVKQYVNAPSAGGSEFSPSPTDRGLMHITITVHWDGGNKEYSTTSLIAR